MTLEQIQERITEVETLLTSIEDAIGGGLSVASFSLFGRSYTYRTLDELQSAHRFWTRKLRSLREQERRAQGKPSRSVLWGRFA